MSLEALFKELEKIKEQDPITYSYIGISIGKEIPEEFIQQAKVHLDEVFEMTKESFDSFSTVDWKLADYTTEDFDLICRLFMFLFLFSSTSDLLSHEENKWKELEDYAISSLKRLPLKFRKDLQKKIEKAFNAFPISLSGIWHKAVVRNKYN